MSKRKDPKSIHEELLEIDARKRGIPFEQAAKENLEYHQSLEDQGIPGGKESNNFFKNMLESILHRRGGAGEKKG